MRTRWWVWVLLAASGCTPDQTREAYLRAERQRQFLLAEHQALTLETRPVESGRAYLVFDLDRREVRARVSGVPLRSAGISWWTRRPMAKACCGVYTLTADAEEIELNEPDSLQVAAPDTTAPAAAVSDSGKAEADSVDSARTDSAGGAGKTPAQPSGTAGEAPVDAPRNVASIRMELEDGVSLWLHGEYPKATGLDSLRTRGQTWLRILPSLAATQDYHLFLPAHEIGWIQAVASESTWVLLLDCQAWARSESRRMAESEEEASAPQSPSRADRPNARSRAAKQQR